MELRRFLQVSEREMIRYLATIDALDAGRRQIGQTDEPIASRVFNKVIDRISMC